MSFLYFFNRAKLLQLTRTMLVFISTRLKKGETIPGKLSSATSLSSYLLKISEFRTNSLILHIIRETTTENDQLEKDQ